MTVENRDETEALEDTMVALIDKHRLFETQSAMVGACLKIAARYAHERDQELTRAWTRCAARLERALPPQR